MYIMYTRMSAEINICSYYLWKKMDDDGHTTFIYRITHQVVDHKLLQRVPLVKYRY